MIGTLLFVIFIVLMVAGVPIGAAMGFAAAVAIALAGRDTQWFGLLAIPQNFYAGLGKYPLLAIPMFVLVGSIFDRSGVAQRLVTFAVVIVGRGPGMLPLVAILVAMVLGGISGSGPATAAAVGGVMILAMVRAGYPPAFSATVVGAAAATDILNPPSIAFIVYSVLTPGASVPAMFAAGMVPDILVGLALMIPSVWLARRHGMGLQEADRAIVKQAALDAGKQEITIARTGLIEADKPLLKQIEGLGVTVTTLDSKEREGFVKAARQVFDKWKEQIGSGLVDKAERSIATRIK